MTPLKTLFGASHVLSALLALSTMLNVALAYRVKILVQAQQPAFTSQRQIPAGTALPPFTATRGDKPGAVTATVTYDDTSRPTVLYIFTPQCVWCERNLGNIKALVAARGNDYRFVGMSLTTVGVTEYVAKARLDIPLYMGISDETKTAYGIVGTPQTIVVSSQGVVVQSWSGAWLGETKSAVEKYFNVTLPNSELD